MALSLLAANNAQTVLAAGISSSATTLTVNTGTGALFPSPSSGVSFFKLTLIDAATGQLTEIVHVTARSGDTMTIDRGQEGTTARAWSANDIAANMMTAGTLTYLLTNFQPLDATLTAIAGLATGANQLPYFTGTDTAAQTPFTSVGRDILSQSTVAALLAYLGVKTAGLRDVGTGTNQIPDMSYFPFTTTTNGTSKLPNGQIYQFGFVATAAAAAVTNITFPTVFPNRILSMGKHTIASSTGTTAQSILEFINVTTSGFGIANIAAIVSGNSAVAAPITTGVYWWAIGY